MQKKLRLTQKIFPEILLMKLKKPNHFYWNLISREKNQFLSHPLQSVNPVQCPTQYLLIRTTMSIQRRIILRRLPNAPRVEVSY